MDKVYIFGHKNPDTDSVCGAIALSYLKNKLGMDTEPRILGTISKETEYVLKKFKEVVPLYLNDVKVQIKDVKYHKNYYMNEERPILDAFNCMNTNGITGLPLIDDNKIFKGYVSLKEIASDMIYNNYLRVNTSFENLLNTLKADDYIKFEEHIVGNVIFLYDSNNLDIKYIDNESIVVVGDNKEVIELAIERKVKLIISIKDCALDKRLRNLAKQARINVISAGVSFLNIAKLLGLSNPIKAIKRDGVIIAFNENDYLTDFNEETSRLKHTNYPILNNKNQCMGLLRTIDAHEVKKKKVILVDHNSSIQSVDGLYESEIVEIIDHHNLADINTSSPVNFRNMSVGAVNTIIYYLYKESNIKIPKNIAGIMLSGIISDTLLLQSPTTTPVDKLVASDLASIAGLKLRQYGLEMLEAGVSIEGLSARDIIYKDLKTYKVGENTMAIGQVFTTNFDDYTGIKEAIINELNRMEDNHDYKMCALFVTDFLTNNSYILYSDNSKKILEIAYRIDELSQGMELKGVVSRKKQMVPYIMPILENL